MNAPIFIADQGELAGLVHTLGTCDAIAVDTESNSLHAWRERVCLIQFSTPTADYLVDAIAIADLSSLASIFANPHQQKIFHAAEYDVTCLGRDYGFSFANLFDTMSAARTLGWPQVGLAAILETRFGVTLNKAHQKADWARRPLTPEQIDYARHDTHHLVALRDLQIDALKAAGCWEEAQEDFARLARLPAGAPAGVPDPVAFWRVKGAYDLTPPQAAILQAVHAFRESEAARQDRPPFKVMDEATLLALALHAPASLDDLRRLARMPPPQIQRYGRGLLQVIAGARTAAPVRPPVTEREPDEVRDRYDRLRLWRKKRAQARGVESDVILPKTTIRDLSRRPPTTVEDLAQIADFGPWRRATYGAEILALLAADAATPA
ncbi:Ribonuclease D [Luteitalea pratensis]|uniref:Ribonuclease D n=1 Tax=Luteitalea pratensis TaxID=1855912 RepID=A0A143PS12_LUTPR|nr:ribonuclease D [Luteitalea pratensis]AMY10890.1 Ribonuclease D [Luteitalea pratensis]